MSDSTRILIEAFRPSGEDWIGIIFLLAAVDPEYMEQMISTMPGDALREKSSLLWKKVVVLASLANEVLNGE